ncbi:uncharacterized protein [Macrobrachium rosenbergii]|uniref:uncharacterized protein n=1 Tax=Macrobrachium rosenbergii TaxID=79674 RepID=UPI0034D4E210
MKFLVIASLCFVVAHGQTRIPPKPNVRTLPADSLRDFPGACFGSTACKIFKVGESWPLAPFCGKATCLRDNNRLIEKVEDCGLKPKESPGCRVVNEADLDKPYPACCPVYECQEGASLQYPSQEEIQAAAREAAARSAAAAGGPGPQQGGGGRPAGPPRN